MRISWVCLAATLALAACGRSTPSTTVSAASPTRASSANAEPDLLSSAGEASTAAAAGPAPTQSPSESATEPPVVALAPPVRSDPAPDAPPLPVATGASPAPVPLAGAKAAQAEIPSSPASTEVSYAPHDECAARPGWKGFRDKLGAAVAARDASALAALSDRNVKLDYGGGAGRPELLRRLRQPAGGLWRELAAILPLGCSIEGGLAALPWFFWRIPPKVDPADTMLVTGDTVPLRAAPKAEARTVATLDWPMVTLAGSSFAPASRFTRVRTRTSRQEGFVETKRLRSLLARRLIVEQQGGEWRITAIVAGD